MKRLMLMMLVCMTALYAALLAGCGGGTGVNQGGGLATTGRAVFTIRWPQRTRLIPDAANSILVSVNQDSKQVGQKLLPRPATGNTTTVTFDPLPVGTLSVTATAFPNVDGTGTAQATATIPLTIQAGQTTNFTLTMASTIQSLVVSAPFPTIEAKMSETLTATAQDAAGNVVLTLPTNIQWSSSNTAVATVDATGKLTAVKAGNVQIMAKEVESGKHGLVNIIVSSAGSLLVYDGLDYPVGQGLANQNGGIGWMGAWNQYGQGDTPSVIIPASLSYSNLLTSGNTLQVTSDNPTGHARTLAQTYGQSGTQLYFSLLVRPIDPFTQQYNYFGFEINGQIFAGKGGSSPNFCLEHDGGSGHVDSNIPAQQNTTYFLVVRVTFKDGPDTIDLFVNPPVGQPLPTKPDVTKSDEDLGMFNGFLLGGGVRTQYDEVRIGTSYAAVSPTQ